MKNYIFLKNGIVIDIKKINENSIIENIENIDTIVEDESEKFNIGDTYTIEKWEYYNLTEYDKINRNIAAIKNKAEELILNKYPIFKQINIIRTGIGLSEMSQYIDNIRNISNIAEKNNTELYNIKWDI